MDTLYLPVLSHFQNGNSWSGSAGSLRYRMTPEGDQITAEVWEGPWCYELSRVEDSREFPMEEERLAELSAWVSGWIETMNARPKKTLEETLLLRGAKDESQSLE